MRGRTRGGDAGNRRDTGRACLSPGPGQAQAGQVDGSAGTSTRPSASIPALYGTASPPHAAPHGDSRLQPIPSLRQAGRALNSGLENPEDR